MLVREHHSNIYVRLDKEFEIGKFDQHAAPLPAHTSTFVDKYFLKVKLKSHLPTSHTCVYRNSRSTQESIFGVGKVCGT